MAFSLDDIKPVVNPVFPANVPLPVRVDEGGGQRVGDSRVSVWLVMAMHRSGESAERIHHSLPTASLADIYALLAYYHGHRARLDPWLDDIDRYSNEIMARVEADPEQQASRERLRARFEAAKAGNATLSR